MNTASTIALKQAPMPPSYRDFLDEAKRFVKSKSLHWNIPLDENGSPTAEERDWDLRLLNGSTARNASRTNGFAVDTKLRDAALAAGWSRASMPQGLILSGEAQDFIKAYIVCRAREGYYERNIRDISRIIRRLFSVMARAPWELNTEDLERFLSLKHKNTKVVDATLALAKTINENLLSLNVPLEPRCDSSLKALMASSLTERKDSKKLPERDALYELTRIVFQETPRTHQDCIRFCIIRLLILTGLRLNEVIMLPRDCLRWESHVDVVTGRPAGEVGGASRTLQLRYFAEKRLKKRAPRLLVEDRQWVPAGFEIEVEKAVNMAVRATAELRTALTEQHRESHLYPNSDLRRFKTVGGATLETADLLFLVVHGDGTALRPKILVDEPIAIMSDKSLYQSVSEVKLNGKSTLFTRYGKTEKAKTLAVKPHSLRHLMNTELFRLGVSDTAITQQFGRQSVAKSYEYDHRSLAERLAFIKLPESATQIVKKDGPEELVAKMVLSGFAAMSHLGKSFKAIQAEHGDEAAFRYLVANSDGFHFTPYGCCINSFSVNPCPKHLKCFNKCRHFVPSGLKKHTVNLQELRQKLCAMRDAAASKPATTVGRKNQIAHAESLLEGVDAALKAQPNVNAFPDGQDFSAPNKDLFR